MYNKYITYTMVTAYQNPYALEATAALPVKVLLGLVIQNTAGI